MARYRKKNRRSNATKSHPKSYERRRRLRPQQRFVLNNPTSTVKPFGEKGWTTGILPRRKRNRG